MVWTQRRYTNNKFIKRTNAPIEAKALMVILEANKSIKQNQELTQIQKNELIKVNILKALNLYLKTSHIENQPPWMFSSFQIEDLKKIILGIPKPKKFKTISEDGNIIYKTHYEYIKPREYMFLRCRNGSKTRDATMLIVFLGYMRNHWGAYNRNVWYSASQSQIDVVKGYLERNKFVKETTLKKATLWNNNEIQLRIMTEKQAVSPRSDYLFFDEQQEMKEHAYSLSLGTGLEINAGRKIHLGTTATDTILHRNYIKLEPLGLVSTHTINDCDWLDEEEALKAYEGFPEWYINTQLYCKWEQPGGRVFDNIEQRDIPNWYNYATDICFGTDPNPKSGHGLVGIAFLKGIDTNSNSEKGIIYIFHSEQLIKDTANYAYAVSNIIERWRHDRRFRGIELESQFGEELYKIITNMKDYYHNFIFTRNWNENNKSRRIEFIRMHQIYYPETIQKKDNQLITQISGAAWDEKSPKPKLAKNPDQHKLDSFIHACFKNIKDLVFIR